MKTGRNSKFTNQELNSLRRCELTGFLDMAARTFGRASFYNGALVRCVGLATTDQIGLVFGKETAYLFSDRGILVGWQAHGTFQSQSCHIKKTTIVFNETSKSVVTFCGERNAIPCFFKPVFMTREEKRGVRRRVGGWVSDVTLDVNRVGS